MTHHHLARAEQDADAARVQLEQTLDELRGRLTPGHMLDEALDYARNGNAGELVRNFGGQVRRNPMPVALVGVGLAWLMMGRGGASARSHEAHYRRAGDDAAHMESGAGETLKDKASRAAPRAGDAVDAAYGHAESAYDSASGMARDMKDRAGSMVDRTSDLGRRTASRMSRAFDDQPLVLGLIGLGLGAALGCMLPGTRTEDRLAGEASDDLKEQAGREMNRQTEKAMHVTERAYEGAMEEGQRAASEEGWMESKEVEEGSTSQRQEAAR